MFVPLGVIRDYCRTWDKWAGAREQVQNGLDAEIEKGAPLTVVHNGNVLTVTNTGTLLPRQAMMMGLSTKSHREELIGEHGEGLKVGCLVLLREGCEVTIRSGDEVWTPAFEYYAGYEAETFGFKVSKGKRNATDKVEVRIEGISAEEWFQWKDRFLNLPGGPRIAKVSCDDGDLLNDPAYAGRIYVKNVFVTERKGMQYGYNFRRLKLDRDRQVIDGHDLYSACARVFSGVGMQDLGWAKRLYKLLAHVTPTKSDEGQGNSEAEGLTWHTHNLSEAVRQEVAREFMRENGEGAVAVVDESEAQVARSAGLKPIQTTRALREVVASIHGSAEKQKKRMAKEVTRVHDIDQDLSEAERQNLVQALVLLGGQSGPIAEFAAHGLEVVDFRLRETQVLCSTPEDPTKYLRIGRAALADVPTLVIAVAKAIGPQKPGLLEFLLEQALRRACPVPAALPAAA